MCLLLSQNNYVYPAWDEFVEDKNVNVQWNICHDLYILSAHKSAPNFYNGSLSTTMGRCVLIKTD